MPLAGAGDNGDPVTRRGPLAKADRPSDDRVCHRRMYPTTIVGGQAEDPVGSVLQGALRDRTRLGGSVQFVASLDTEVQAAKAGR